TATKPAYLPGTYGAKRPDRPGTPIVLTDGQRVAGIAVALARGGVIAGTIRSAAGRPVEGMQVIALPVSGPVPRTITPFATTNDSSFTDDRGAYRIFGLRPGGYTVAVVPAGGSPAEMYRRATAEVDAVLRELQQRGGLSREG